ncbi:hypothetical protein [Salinibius halmophilus]|uniref:hypothetical protein n=1 Tax=Salinibius halmophilus TaxID=1853216 RepID=UPI000E661BFD|nr:hypothetical protein [Salinibius halmophilus]
MRWFPVLLLLTAHLQAADLIGGWTCYGVYPLEDGSEMTLITNENFLPDQHHSFGEVQFNLARYEVALENNILLTNSWQKEGDTLEVTIERSFILGDAEPRFEQLANLEGRFQPGTTFRYTITRLDRKHLDLSLNGSEATVACDRKRQIILD